MREIKPGGALRTRYFVIPDVSGFSSNIPIKPKMAELLKLEGYEEVSAETYYSMQHEWEKQDLQNPELLTSQQGSGKAG